MAHVAIAIAVEHLMMRVMIKVMMMMLHVVMLIVRGNRAVEVSHHGKSLCYFMLLRLLS